MFAEIPEHPVFPGLVRDKGVDCICDEDLASVLTYIRREWGHGADPVDPDKVEAIRKATKGRADAWTVKELEEVE